MAERFAPSLSAMMQPSLGPVFAWRGPVEQPVSFRLTELGVEVDYPWAPKTTPHGRRASTGGGRWIWWSMPLRTAPYS